MLRHWSDVLAHFDWSLLFAAVSLTAIGLLAIYGMNVSRGELDLFQFKKQLLGALIGIIIAIAIAFVDYRQLKAFALPAYLIGLVLLLFVLFIGKNVNGGGRWFELGSLTFQPVEPAKLTLAAFMASYLSKFAGRRLSWTVFIGSALALMCYVVPVILQPDIGSALVLFAIWLAAVLFCGLPRNAWWILILVALTGGLLLWTVGLKPYQRSRIESFVNPSADTHGAAYNVRQAEIAVGSGGVFGTGIGQGSQARLRFLPVASSDFIFAVVGEELGFVGIVVVIGLFVLLLMRFIKVGNASEDPFAAILCIECAAFIAFHVWVNAGMNLGISPVTGIPLPFVSAAASSLLIMYGAVGLAESVATQRIGVG